MSFNSIQYLIFLPLVVILFYILKPKYRWGLLLIASYYFYMSWNALYILLIVLSTIVDYWCGLKMGDIPEKKDRRLYLRISMVSNLIILGVFKYYNFFNDSFAELFNILGLEYMIPALSVILPVGISFYTFQTLSYSVDIYRGNLKPEKNFGKFALYVCFFPQLVAGPIERAKDLLKQFDFKAKLEAYNISSGLRLIILGLFKKVLVADQLGSMVSYVFDQPENQNGFNALFASLLFTQQIYCDFSAYSDIAQGSAKMFGVRLIDNFKLPFFSKNMAELWGNWHVSLMNWFKDYIMIPLIRKKWKWQQVFLIIFLTSGLWHGANWTFVLWGLYHGLMSIYSKATIKWRANKLTKLGWDKNSRSRKALQIFCVFMISAISAPLFRGYTIENAFGLYKLIFSNWIPDIQLALSNQNQERFNTFYLGRNIIPFISAMVMLAFLEIIQYCFHKKGYENWLTSLSVIPRWSFYVIITILICIYSNLYNEPYIYFQF